MDGDAAGLLLIFGSLGLGLLARETLRWRRRRRERGWAEARARDWSRRAAEWSRREG
jgi:hypothetical protein